MKGAHDTCAGGSAAVRSRLLAGAVCLAIVGFAAGCDLLKRLKPGEDAGPDGGSAAPVAEVEAGAAPSTGANAKEVARFGDETPLDEVTELSVTATPRLSPPGGPAVATLAHGVSVTKIAQHEGFVLINFANPKNASETLMGWVPAGVLPGGSGTAPHGGGSSAADGGHALGDAGKAGPVAVVDSGAAPSTCPAGDVMLLTKLCAKACKTNADCLGKVCVPHVPTMSPPGSFSNVCLGR